MQAFDPEAFVEKCTGWLVESVRKAGASGTISGLSGGIDSAVVAVLAKEAELDHRSLFIDIESAEQDFEDAKTVAEKFFIPLQYIQLTGAFNALKEALGEANHIAVANLKPRLRMVALYYFANAENRLVLGTSNKSELMVGYFTKYGDGGSDLLPIGSLYKTQVRKLAQHLGIPEKIINKPPSAGLWEGQTDEEELGITYEQLDRVLDAIETGDTSEVDKQLLSKVEKMIKLSEHKRHTPPVFLFEGS